MKQGPCPPDKSPPAINIKSIMEQPSGNQTPPAVESTKKTRTNWSLPENTEKLKMAATKWDEETKKPKKDQISFSQFCKTVAEDIPRSTLQNYINNGCLKPKKSTGRPSKLSELLAPPPNLQVVQRISKLRTNHLDQIVETWRKEELQKASKKNKTKDGGSSLDKRKRLRYFCSATDMSIIDKPGWMKKVVIDKHEASSIRFLHIPIFDRRHWMYVCVDVCEMTMKFYDSITLKTRSGPDEKGTEIMVQIENRLKIWVKEQFSLPFLKIWEKEQGEGIDFTKVVVRGIPKQNDISSCGYFVLFFMDCVRRGITIPERVSTAEIKNYVTQIKIKLGQIAKEKESV